MNTFKYFFSIIILLNTSKPILCYGQDEKKSLDDNPYISFYPELAGNGGLLSLNIEIGYCFNQRSGILLTDEERKYKANKLSTKENRKSGIYVRMGKGDDYSGINLVFESGYFLGNKKHNFDTGFGYSSGTDSNYYMIRFGYRYHGNKGLLIRLAPLLVYKIEDNGIDASQRYEKQWGATGGLSLGYIIPINN